MSLLLEHKLALVTGAGGGIGRATCAVLAREGAKVIATDVNIKDTEETLALLSGHGHMCLILDVTSNENITSVFNSILEKFKQPPSVIVNCAGLLEKSFIQDSTTCTENFQTMLHTNLVGMFAVIQTGVKELIKECLPGSIINISSVASSNCAPGTSFYSASKAGVDSLTKSIAKEIAKHNIRCNTINPGLIDTPMALKLVDGQTENMAQKIDECALKRIGRPEEVAEVVAFLASDRSSYITGTCIPVNGGM